jgi:hypothetical protein
MSVQSEQACWGISKMTKRQTIRVQQVKEQVNTYLANLPTGKTPEEIEMYKNLRRGASSVIENILHNTGNYMGYGYIDSPYVEGVTDESRRYYY